MIPEQQERGWPSASIQESHEPDFIRMTQKQNLIKAKPRIATVNNQQRIKIKALQTADDKNVEGERRRFPITETTCNPATATGIQYQQKERLQKICYCEECKVFFYDLKHLRNHIAETHYVRDFVCHVCGRKFVRKDNARQHVRRVHEKKDLRKAHCMVCSKFFCDASNLRRHQRTQSHKEEKERHDKWLQKKSNSKSIMLQTITTKINKGKRTPMSAPPSFNN